MNKYENSVQQSTVLSLRAIARRFQQGSREITVLDGASTDIGEAQTVALIGPSGAGKSTLLHIAGLLEKPDQGEVWISGENCAQLNDGERTRLRRKHIGFVYQFHQLLPEFTALENILLPQLINGKARSEGLDRARYLLNLMGLEDRLDHRPAELSGGEQQRVAIARSIANQPRLLLADEPTGNLDPSTAERVFDQLLNVVRTEKLGAIIATHNHALAEQMDRTVKLENGKLLDLPQL
ncbi:MAG: ABC transporter ATP-binding protein [Methyloligellaceae bacterium]